MPHKDHTGAWHVSQAEKAELRQLPIFRHLIDLREAELRSSYETEVRHLQALFQRELEQLLAETLVVCFPTAPLSLVHGVYQIAQPAELRRLIVAIQQAPDLAAAAQLLRDAAEQSGEPSDTGNGTTCM